MSYPVMPCAVAMALLLTAPARAEDAPSPEGPKTVIHLPLKLRAASQPAADGKAAAKPAAKAEAPKPKAETPAPAKSAETAKPPEKMEPTVKMAAPPARAITEVSPEVRAPGAKPHKATKKKKKVVKAQDAEAAEHAGELAQVRATVKNMVSANSRYAAAHKPGYFSRFASQQTPRATVVTCSDSRVQTNALSADPVNELFMVRDIGNQLATAEGSIEYGVRHLHTPLLMFVGHSVCGAVKAAAEDYSALEPAIRREIATINIPKGIDPTNGALVNVNNQVEGAILKFSGEVEAGKLAVLGAFYDFRNDLKQGAGRLVITNINGETDPARIKALMASGQYFKYAFMGQ